MFSIEDSSTDDVINLDLTSFSEIGHTHESSSITDLKSTIIDLVYPVGSIYTSMDSTSPAEKFGGTWEQIVDGVFYVTQNDSSVSTSWNYSLGVDYNSSVGSNEDDVSPYIIIYCWQRIA